MRATATAPPRVWRIARCTACTMSAGISARLRWNWLTASLAASAASLPWPRPSTMNSVQCAASRCNAQASPDTTSPALAISTAPTRSLASGAAPLRSKRANTAVPRPGHEAT